MEVSLKRATIKDIPKLIEIEKKLDGSKIYSAMISEKEWQEEINKENARVYLIIKDGVVVGDVSYETESESATIAGLAISPEFQKMGVGQKTMEIILDELKDLKLINLLTHPENIGAVKLYQSLGFVIKDKKENYFGDGEPRILMLRIK